MDIITVFASNVKMYRTNRGLSQDKLAEMTGLHRTYISAIECKKRSIALENVQKIADALVIDTYLLFKPCEGIKTGGKNESKKKI